MAVSVSMVLWLYGVQLALMGIMVLPRMRLVAINLRLCDVSFVCVVLPLVSLQ